MFSPAPCIFLSILCAGLCVPGQSSYIFVFIVYIKRRDGVSCSVYDMLHIHGHWLDLIITHSGCNNI